ncbi:5-(carboxyamino)imidazole ribonucleotide synthase [Chelativorans salis]|uniref:N5-carboxyaminoimidazole ribonucleotide synthase n=1 Tax=Chelativorans salis TaxID=2978478 RepID=A0ABT2LPR0_9HYPH|nr:5-(carboxyamino)imidazole ribonucleotide synthase [Chelativorans sp. EGI FJ00035]MCT7376538.1 5-(carboxyamino)imidazole ribonucleotide synthase [Chelativorans sp. EGI FJ00035]
MTKALAPGATIGIVGGGQLGRMLAMAAAGLGYRTAILEPDRDCPAAQVAGLHIAAPYDDGKALEKLANASDVVTYEFENVPISAIRSLNEQLAVYPPPEALEAAQDRLAEKIFLNSAGVSTAPFISVDNDEDLERGLSAFGGRGVLKTRRMGYDGKGQRVFRSTTRDVKGCFAQMGGVPLVLEDLVAFEREVSVIAARGTDGSMAAYDPAENIHRDGILFRSNVPAAISPATAETARETAFTILSALGYVGVIGVEFFVMKDGTLLANEIAPRVHNSGHWTEAACLVSQFEQHIRAVAGLPLGSTTRHANCVMTNLLGTEQERAAALLAEPDVVLHLYGKAEARPGRKMGHYTRLLPLDGNPAGGKGSLQNG